MLSPPMAVLFYVEWLRSWAQRVRRERYPHHIVISVDGRVRLEAWLDARRVDAFMLQDAMMSVWNASPDLKKIGQMTRVGSCLTLTATDGAPHAIEIASVSPVAWRPRHALAWCVSKLLPGLPGWTVREVAA